MAILSLAVLPKPCTQRTGRGLARERESQGRPLGGRVGLQRCTVVLPPFMTSLVGQREDSTGMIAERSPSEDGLSMAWSMVKGTAEIRPHVFQRYSLCPRGRRRLSSGTPRALLALTEGAVGAFPLGCFVVVLANRL